MAVLPTDHSMDEPEALTELFAKIREYNPKTNQGLIRKAYFFAEQAHSGQKRLSGDPYIIHPLNVANIVVDIRMDDETICAALLHDVVEDTKITHEDMEKEFGESIAHMVDGVTKLKSGSKANDPSESDFAKRRQESARAAENIRKMLLAMARDIRVMIIKLADRLHNIQTLYVHSEAKQKQLANETMQIYAPLASRLGIWQFKWQLEDYAFKYLYPNEYTMISERVSRTRRERDLLISKAVLMVKERLEGIGIRSEVQGRSKHLWSIYQKIVKQEIPFDEVYDLLALRIIVETEPECYNVLGIVHDIWQPLPGLFFDYIAMPKANGYRSLHTKVMGPSSDTLEVQIRTWSMHRMAEYGMAAHWQYKEGGNADEGYTEKFGRLRQQLFDWSNDAKNSSEFLKTVVENMFIEQVFVFTPKGDVLDLPVGATSVDVAYRIHTEIGNRVVGAKINGKIEPLNYTLKNGDIVDIMTRQNASPSSDWLAFTKTTSARQKIRQYLRKARRSIYAQHGKDAIERELKLLKLELKEHLGEEKLHKIADELKREGVEDLLAAVGEGLITVNAIVSRLRGVDQTQHVEHDLLPTASEQQKRSLEVNAEGMEAMMLRRARCCCPVPGDEVVGYVTRGKGIVIHRDVCANVKHYSEEEPERLMSLNWNSADEQCFSVPIRILSVNRPGTLANVTKIVGDAKANITSGKIQSTTSNSAVMELIIEIRNHEDLQDLFLKLKTLPDVLEVSRVVSQGKR